MDGRWSARHRTGVRPLSLSTTVWVLVLAPVAVLAAPLLRREVPTVAAPVGTEQLGVPWSRILLVGVALVLFYMVDTSATTWGPVYLSSPNVFDNPPTNSSMFALATLPYLAATLLARLFGDGLTSRLGARTVVRGGSVLAFIGLAIIIFAPRSTWQIGILGFFVVGLEVAVIARFNQFNYVGALLGAVLTGAIGSGNLRIGYAVPMVLVLALIPLARHFVGPASRTPAADNALAPGPATP